MDERKRNKRKRGEKMINGRKKVDRKRDGKERRMYEMRRTKSGGMRRIEVNEEVARSE